MASTNTQVSHSDILLEAHNLAAGYDLKNIFEGICFQVLRGEIRVILGASGCGKTTLLKVLIGHLTPKMGKVILFGHDFFTLNENMRTSYYTRIGMLFQSGALLNALTVKENIALPLKEHTSLHPEEIEDIVWMKLALVGLEKFSNRMPRQLSGGMRKRAALARALALDPELLFCDEPSAGLDPNTAADLDDLIMNLREKFGMAIIVVSHELSSIHRIADRVLMLHQGKMLLDANLKEAMLSQNKSVKAFFNRLSSQSESHHPDVLETLKGIKI